MKFTWNLRGITWSHRRVVIYFTNNVRPEIISSYRNGESVNGVKAVFLSNARAIVVRIEARSGLKDRAWKLRACFGREWPIQRATLVQRASLN